MQCPHFDAGRCRSCTLLPLPYDRQVADKQAHVARLLADAGIPAPAWLPPVTSAQAGFRNKAKMVVSGTTDAPLIGILGPDGEGVDLRDCALHTPGLQAALPLLAEFVRRATIAPYDVGARRGELKHLIATESPDGDLMVRFVLRSQEPVARIRKHLPWLHEQLPRVAVVSVNLQPEHKAVLEGEREILLTEQATLPMRLGGVELHLRPQGFFQTSTTMARELYRQARDWVEERSPRTVWDLYCGVGGFALHAAGPGRAVTGVEISGEAVEAASLSAADLGVAWDGRTGVRFEEGDAVAWATRQPEAPDLVVVNPPRRGIGAELAGWLERSGVSHVVYSSCNATTLARDLGSMPGLVPVEARLLDMFPNTGHYEVVTVLDRR
jgi:23S rRNA (uracil747-C5)-methyltransferase